MNQLNNSPTLIIFRSIKTIGLKKVFLFPEIHIGFMGAIVNGGKCDQSQ